MIDPPRADAGPREGSEPGWRRVETESAGQLDIPATTFHGGSVDSLRRRWGVPALHLYRQVGSTNDVARALAEAGAPTGSAVVAQEQVAGRGRAGRGWSSAVDRGLWLSIITRPPRTALPGVLPLLAAWQVARVVECFLAPGTVGVKWPNDIVVGERKLAGILCEAAWSGDTPLYAVVGVGVNVLQEEHEFPVELRALAISLHSAGARDASVLAVADRLVPALAETLERPPPIDEVLAHLSGRDALQGQPVIVSDPATGLEFGRGIAVGITPEGALLLRDASGRLQSVRAGTIRKG